MELKTDEGKRKQYLRPRRALFLGVTLGVPALSILLTAVLPREWYYGTPLGYILGTGIFSCIFSLIGLGLYYADCSGSCISIQISWCTAAIPGRAPGRSSFIL